LLQSQAQNKLQNYSKSAELYVNILKKFPKAEDYADILVNAIASAISSEVNNLKRYHNEHCVIIIVILNIFSGERNSRIS